MTTNRTALRQAILDLLPQSGESLGNIKLRQLLAERFGREIDESLYVQVRDQLIAEGLVATGRGRGGSVRRVVGGEAVAVDEVDAPEEPLVLRPYEAPKKEVTEVRAKSGASPKAQTSTARSSKSQGAPTLSRYHHLDKRKNNPEVGLVTPENDPPKPKTRWAYDPHIDPALQFDVGRAQIEKLIDDALASGDEAQMRRALEELRRLSAPYLNWAGKAERTSFEVDTVSLHVHERIDPLTLLSAVKKRITTSRDYRQPDLFSSPFDHTPLREAIDFYRHQRGWANRLIAGDSLLVMNSLLQKEGMAGQVQMIYIDPPYGIKYGSNFQPFVNKRDVKDRRDEDLTQEPEMIKAFRDTWELGIHSYLTYLRDRLLLARELLHESGSVFVQISDENLHHVRELLDDVFGPKNYLNLIPFAKTSGVTTSFLASNVDFILWYGKDRSRTKYHPLYIEKNREFGTASTYSWLDSLASPRRGMTSLERQGKVQIPPGSKVYKHDNITSQGNPIVEFVHLGKIYAQPWKTDKSGVGLRRLARTRRLHVASNSLQYVRYLGDFPCIPITQLWDDTQTGSFTEDKMYVVQTAQKVIERCILMTTDPGDLVLDPTCGSGTTAYVAEKWGRRWITCDTSRVAITLAKQRLMTASYDYYELKYPHEGLKGGFIYKTVPHVTLKSIANNPEIDEIYERMHPAIEGALEKLNEALRKAPPAPFRVEEGGRKGKTVDFTAPASKTVELPSGEKAPAGALLEWEVPFDFPADWPQSARPAFDAFHEARRAMQAEMDASIARNADQEILYDQPQIDKSKVRVTGPFTVEAVPFPSVRSLDEPLPSDEPDASLARSGETYRLNSWRDELLKTGIRGRNGQMLHFASLELLPDTRHLHLTGALVDTGERVLVSFGPEYAALEQRQVEMAIHEARKLRPAASMIVFCAFAFDPEAAKDIDETNWPGVTLLKVQMNTDLLTEDLKKARSSNQSFWLMGQPDVEVRQRKDGLYEVEVHGFDYFDTIKGEVVSGGKGKIAVWMLDTDYNERSLFPHQVFFPMAGAKDGWNKLRKDVRAELDESLLSAFHGTVSLPFEKGKNGKIAVKVVDDRGIESIKVIDLP